MSDWIKFMGTAGARFVVSQQLRSSAGIWCYLRGKHVLIDPGPGTLSRCFSINHGLNPAELDVIILTHRHLDHSTDVNVMVEAMTRGTYHHRGALFAPSDAVEGEEPVVFRHVRNAVERLEILKEKGSYDLGPFRFETPVRHNHSAETYGLKFVLPQGCVSFIVDTKIFPALAEHYVGSDILIMNVLLYELLPVKEVFHLDLAAARELIEGIKPRIAVMTHFGTSMLHHKPHLLAQRLTAETGIKVIAATDGFTLDIDEALSGAYNHSAGGI